MMKNYDIATVLTMKEQVAYQPGQVVSKTLAQNAAVSVTLFAFDKGEEISTHESGGDALVLCLDGEGRITEDMMISAAHAIAGRVSPAELAPDYIIPSIFDKAIAAVVADAVKAHVKE